MDDTLSPDGTIRERDALVVAVFPSSWTASIIDWPATGRVTFDLMNYPRGDIHARVVVDVELERCFTDGGERPAGEISRTVHARFAPTPRRSFRTEWGA
jgi:hypothetical protein